MTIQVGDTEQRVPMTWHDYLVLSDSPPSEYFGGQLVVSPLPNRQHADIVKTLQRAIDDNLAPGTRSYSNWGWSPRGIEEELGPDVMVVPETDDFVRFTGIPLLVVEVLSGNRHTDLTEKAQRYAMWGAHNYWIVDPRDHVVLTYALADGELVRSGIFTDGGAKLRYGDVAVPVDIDALLA